MRHPLGQDQNAYRVCKDLLHCGPKLQPWRAASWACNDGLLCVALPHICTGRPCQLLLSMPQPAAGYMWPAIRAELHCCSFVRGPVCVAFSWTIAPKTWALPYHCCEAACHRQPLIDAVRCLINVSVYQTLAPAHAGSLRSPHVVLCIALHDTCSRSHAPMSLANMHHMQTAQPSLTPLQWQSCRC